jgi:ParB family chromosome partitioning protein
MILSTEPEYKKILISKIKTGMSQARTRRVEKDLDVLMESLRKFGLLEPVTLYKNKDDTWTLIAGQRRLLAAKAIGWLEIGSMIIPMPEDLVREKAISYVENVVRENMVDQDQIDACVTFFKKYRTVKAVAEELGIPSAKVRKYIKYDRLPDLVKTEVDSNKINTNVAIRATDALTWDGGSRESEEKVLDLAEQMQKLSTEQQNQIVRVGSNDPSKSVKEIIEKAKKRAGKKVTTIFLDEDYLKIEKYSDKEGKDSISDAVHDLTKEGLGVTGYDT